MTIIISPYKLLFILSDSFSMSSNASSALQTAILFGLGWTFYKTAERRSSIRATNAYVDENGKVLEFDDVAKLQSYKPGQRFFSFMDQFPKPTVLQVTAVVTLLWGFRFLRSVNRLMERRYSDIAYQILRPDVLRNRVSALKYFGTGLMVIPAIAGLVFACADLRNLKGRAAMASGSLHTDSTSVLRRVGLVGTDFGGNLRHTAASNDIREFISNLKAKSDSSIWKV